MSADQMALSKQAGSARATQRKRRQRSAGSGSRDCRRILIPPTRGRLLTPSGGWPSGSGRTTRRRRTAMPDRARCGRGLCTWYSASHEHTHGNMATGDANLDEDHSCYLPVLVRRSVHISDSSAVRGAAQHGPMCSALQSVEPLTGSTGTFHRVSGCAFWHASYACASEALSPPCRDPAGCCEGQPGSRPRR